VIVLLAAAILLGHHSLAADFDTSKPVTLTGRVDRIEWMNPHVHIYLDVNGQHWSVEMGSPNGLMQRGWTPKTIRIGDLVSVEGSRAKDGSNIANAHSIVLPSGTRLSAAPPEGKTS